ncbi:fimbrial protein [Amantichitinum ursilacus]|uniref:F17e-G fimbrial adhesin n=1 Tax=Amantichitinum ursilacus TaxID=857265 RepID=A0A0N1JTC1_9NEIS|nr:fimbrial protein [Amantichitinum ursilacus]KPC54120.1 F17e-G fimbrial adhesin precursor [Amantichitinum ursilacus]
MSRKAHLYAIECNPQGLFEGATACSRRAGKPNRQWGRWFIGALLMAGASYSYAGCVQLTGLILPLRASYAVSSNAAIGDVVAEAEGTWQINCSTTEYYGIQWYGNDTLSMVWSNGKNLIKSGIPGIGFYIKTDPSPYINRTPDFSPNGSFSLIYQEYYQYIAPGPLTIHGTFQWVVYGPVSTGGYTIPIKYRPAALYGAASGGAKVLYFGDVTVPPALMRVDAPTCEVSVDTKNQAINLGSLPVKGPIGSKGPTSNFSVVLDCAGGNGVTKVDAYITFSDANNPANGTRVLSLSPDSTAAGVGVEVSNSSGPLLFGPETESVNPAQWLGGTSTNGRITIPLSANMVQTAAVPTPGEFSAATTFTINYR